MKENNCYGNDFNEGLGGNSWGVWGLNRECVWKCASTAPSGKQGTSGQKMGGNAGRIQKKWEFRFVADKLVLYEEASKIVSLYV